MERFDFGLALRSENLWVLATPLDIRRIVIMSGVEIGGVQLSSPETLSDELENISSELLTHPLKDLTFRSFSLSPLFFGVGTSPCFFNTRNILRLKHRAHIIFFYSFLIQLVSIRMWVWGSALVHRCGQH